MLRRLRLGNFGLMVVLVLGCGGPPANVVRLTAVKGIVTLDGKPLPEGEIAFLLVGQSPIVLPVTNGDFSGNAIAGTNKIQVRSSKSGQIPTRFNDETKLSQQVLENTANEFKFAVTSK